MIGYWLYPEDSCININCVSDTFSTISEFLNVRWLIYIPIYAHFE